MSSTFLETTRHQQSRVSELVVVEEAAGRSWTYQRRA